MTQWPQFQQYPQDGNEQSGVQQPIRLKPHLVEKNSSLSSLEVARRIQQTASMVTIGQNQHVYTGHELVEVLTTMYPASSEERGKPVRLGTIRRVYQVPAPIGALAWTPDGKHIALSYEKTVLLFDIETREEVVIFSPHVLFKEASVRITNVAFSPDAKWVALARSDKEVEVQDATSGAYEVMYSGHSAQVVSVAWSHTGNSIASCDIGGLVQVWDFATGKLIYEFRNVHWSNNSSHGTHLLWSADDKLLIACQSNRYATPACIWQGKKGLTYTRHQGRVRTVAFSPDGKRVASSSEDQTIQIWGVQDDKGVFTFRVHTLPVTHLSWSPDGTHLASADAQGIVFVWQAG